MRRNHQKLAANFGNVSLQGSTMGHQHRVDPVTGMYKGKQIVNVAKRAKTTPEE